MAASYTINAGLGIPGLDDADYQATIDPNWTILDGYQAVGGGAVTPNERPSTSLIARVAPFAYKKSDGTRGVYAGGTITLAGAATNYLFLDATAAYALASNTTGYPATACVPIAAVTTTTAIGSIVDGSIVDGRTAWTTVGTPQAITMGVGANFVLDTATGSKLGTATTQKLGFWGATPIVQPSGAAQAALADSTGGTASTTLAAIAAGATYAQADLVALKNAVASLAALANALRSALVAAGLVKGSA